MVHSLSVPVIRSQQTSPVVNTEMVDEYVPVEPYMVDGVPLSLCMDKY